MDLTNQVNVIGLYIIIWLVATVTAWLLLYSAIRLGVKHGLRCHTRWVDEGKDYVPSERVTGDRIR